MIIPTTGTGWVDPVAARAIESMYNGDTALVAMQYSYLPSWISFLADKQKSLTAGAAMVNLIHQRWSQWRRTTGPNLLCMARASVRARRAGAFGFLPDVVAMDFSSVLWVGPPNASSLWKALTERRDPRTPEVQPRWRQRPGGAVRAGFEPRKSRQSPLRPGSPRVLFLQHPSDPVVWWSSDLLFERPDWLAEPPGSIAAVP